MDSGTLAKTLHKALKELGHEDLPLGHVYEAMAIAAGYKSWNVAKPKLSAVSVEAPHHIGSGNFEVKVNASVFSKGQEIEAKKYYRVTATDELGARAIVQEYLDYQSGLTEYDDLSERARDLTQAEDENDFKYKNWEIIYLEAEFSITDIRRMGV